MKRGITVFDRFNNFYSFTPISYFDAWTYYEDKEDGKIIKTLVIFTTHGSLEFTNITYSNFNKIFDFTEKLNLPIFTLDTDTEPLPYLLPNKTHSIYFWTFFGVFLYLMVYFFMFIKDFKNLGYVTLNGKIQSVQIENKYNLEIKLYEFPNYVFHLKGKKAYEKFNAFKKLKDHLQDSSLQGKEISFKVSANQLKVLRKYKLLEKLELFWGKKIDIQVIEYTILGNPIPLESRNVH